MPARPLDERLADDRVRRYLDGEPIKRIAAAHGVKPAAISNWIRRNTHLRRYVRDYA